MYSTLRAQTIVLHSSVDSLRKQEIAKYPNGKWLIHLSDAFAHLIESEVEAKVNLPELHRTTKHVHTILAVDTTLDVSNEDHGQDETATEFQSANTPSFRQ
jgi:beta-galactosidase beta subunit